MQIEHNLHFAPCAQTDVTNAVPLIYSTGPDAFDYVFKNSKNTAHDFLTYAFQSKGGEFSFDNHIGLYDGETLIGIGSRFSKKDASKFLFYDGKNILSFYKLTSATIIIHGLKVESMIRPPAGKEIALAHIAISPEFRGKGLGSKIMKHLQSLPKAKDQYYVLDVSLLNPRAQALYERLGYKIAKTNKSTLKSSYATVPNHHRMELI
jgi:ribosomal protein S18 acetylase RimI-like enzyme